MFVLHLVAAVAAASPSDSASPPPPPPVVAPQAPPAASSAPPAASSSPPSPPPPAPSTTPPPPPGAPPSPGAGPASPAPPSGPKVAPLPGSPSPSIPTPPATPPPTPPTPPIDPTTGNPLPLLDETGQPIILVDETGQPIVRRDETGQIILPPGGTVQATEPRNATLLAGLGPEEADARGFREWGVGATDYHAHVAIIEGYNTNVVQSQLVLGGPTTQNPAFFTGVDLALDMITWTTLTDRQDIRLGVRGQFYAPINGNGSVPPVDGTALASLNRSFTLSPSTIVYTGLGATLTSSNSALIQDGALFQVDPSNLDHVYTLENADVGLGHQLASRWRMGIAIDETVESTLSQGPTVDAATGGTVVHQGLDFATTSVDLNVSHELDPYNMGTLLSHTTAAYIPFTVNYGVVPPVDVGASTNVSETLQALWGHAYTEHLSSIVQLGATLAAPPPNDGGAAIMASPTGQASLIYARNYWLAHIDAGYAYGTANPALGYGFGAFGGAELRGVPYAHGIWNKLSVLAAGTASESQLIQPGGAETEFKFVVGSAEARWSLNTWLGLEAGYNVRYASYGGAGAPPSLFRQIVFVGLSGYFANDKSLPTLETFASPTTPM